MLVFVKDKTMRLQKVLMYLERYLKWFDLKSIEIKLPFLAVTFNQSRMSVPFWVRRDLMQFTGRRNELSFLKHTLLGEDNSTVVICRNSREDTTGDTLISNFTREYRKHFPDGIFSVSINSESSGEFACKLSKHFFPDQELSITNDHQAHSQIQKCLSSKRALLILVNIESEKEYQCFKNILPKVKLMSVLITTCNKDFAKGIDGNILDIESFKDEDSIRFLKHKLIGEDNSFVITCGISGMGGVGKSALAAHFAEKYSKRFPDGVFSVSVDSESPAGFALRLASHFFPEQQLSVTNDSHAHTLIQKYLSSKRALLILDNADSDKAFERVTNMLPGGTSMSVIVTTRNKVLAEDFDAYKLDLNSFTGEEGIEHFKNVLGKDFHLKGSIKNAERIIELLGGLPLAIDIVVQTMKNSQIMTFDSWVEYLEQQGVIGELSKDKKSNETINLVIEKSLDLLASSLKNIFISLGACAITGFSVETAMAATGIKNVGGMRLSLNKLHNWSLVNELENKRFSLHPVLKDFTQSKEEIIKANHRHTEYWRSYVKKYNRDDSEDWIYITNEWNGICVAWDWCLSERESSFDKCCNVQKSSHRNYKYASEIAFSLRYFLDGRGHWREGIERFSKSLNVATKISLEEEIVFRIRRHLAIFLRKSKKYEEAANYNNINIEFAANLKREDWRGQELEQLGRVRVRQKQYKKAEDLYKEALGIARKLEEKRYIGQALNCLGTLYRHQRKYPESIGCFEDVLQLYKDLSDDQGICSTLKHLGDTYLDCRNYSEAKDKYLSAMKVFKKSGRIEVEGSLYQNLGFALEKLLLFDVDALAFYIISANICNHLGICGWGDKYPFRLRDNLLEKLASNADDFRVSSNNTLETVLKNSRSRIKDL